MALEGVAEGLTWQKIAARFWDPDWVAEEWYVGSWMRQRVKRRLSRARTMLKQYRDMATGAVMRVGAWRRPARCCSGPRRVV